VNSDDFTVFELYIGEKAFVSFYQGSTLNRAVDFHAKVLPVDRNGRSAGRIEFQVLEITGSSWLPPDKSLCYFRVFPDT